MEHARRRKWLVIEMEARTGQSLMSVLVGQIFQELRDAGRTWSGETLTWVRRVFKAFSLTADPSTGTYSFEVDLEPAGSHADGGDPDRDLPRCWVNWCHWQVTMGWACCLRSTNCRRWTVRHCRA